MSISWQELATISLMTNRALLAEHESPKQCESNEDSVDYLNAIETEMESRGMPHP